ncbi:hypothetical protein MHTCC0001_18530 [Flavobacteriaceae bacterium MHTCC 0001]
MLFFNKFHGSFLDSVFSFLSATGNGVSIAVFGVLLLVFFKFKYAAKFLMAFVMQLIVLLLCKNVFFHYSKRPFRYFGNNEGDVVINLIEGVRIYTHNTFPSGHTSTIFFIVTFLALEINNKVFTWISLTFALCVGFSRIYLVQHFLTDVYFGMIFGTTSSMLAYLILNNVDKSWYDKQLIPKLSWNTFLANFSIKMQELKAQNGKN